MRTKPEYTFAEDVSLATEMVTNELTEAAEELRAFLSTNRAPKFDVVTEDDWVWYGKDLTCSFCARPVRVSSVYLFRN